jgi:leader peptidase (prepilin peptidase)/N-methyltransferase
MDTFRLLKEYPNYFLLLIAAVSLLIGSFLNVVIYRLPKMLAREWSDECRQYLGLQAEPLPKEPNLWWPGSQCPNCKTLLKAWHNIPLISYLILKGQCAYCKISISPRYPFVELLTCLTSVYVAYHFGFSTQTVGALLFTWILIGLTFIDLDHQLLPDQLTFALGGIGLLLSLFPIFVTSHDAIIGFVAGYMIFSSIQNVFFLVTGKIGMGEGDYKLLAAIGAFVGWQLLPLVILLSSVTACIVVFTHMVISRKIENVPIPFGPYLAIAGWVSLIWGTHILAWYLTILKI